MDLVRDLLDKIVVDRHGREVGRVDSLVLELKPGAPPRLDRIEIGPAVLGRRIHPVLGRWIAGLEVALGIAEGRPLRVPFAQVLDIDVHVKVDLAVGETVAARAESRLRAWLRAVPGK